jgi:putative lipoic acid-binding regulatory protein
MYIDSEALRLWAKTDKEQGHQNNSEDNDSSSALENTDATGSSLQQPLSSDGLPLRSASVKIDDGGSDLTDRFKYKVQALMGNFDPVDATQDTEQTSGNILGAMLNFPTLYTFHAVGRLYTDNKGDNVDDRGQQAFVELVQETVRKGAGLRDDAELQTTTIPRSSKFVKVSVQVVVENGMMVTEIYDMLGDLPNCVMQF